MKRKQKGKIKLKSCIDYKTLINIMNIIVAKKNECSDKCLQESHFKKSLTKKEANDATL